MIELEAVLVTEIRKALQKSTLQNVGVSVGRRNRQHDRAVTIREISSLKDYNLDAAETTIPARVQIDVFSATVEDRDAIYQVVEATLPDGTRAVFKGPNDEDVEIHGCTRERRTTFEEPPKDQSDTWTFRHATDWLIHYEEIL